MTAISNANNGLRSFEAAAFALASIVLCSLGAANGVRISRLSVPNSVENGTAESVILDCIYEYSDEDQQLVVKWFFNQDTKPIYQWIPDLNKRSYSKSRFEGHINRHYEITNDAYTKYRALNIIRPTTEMTGTYSCSVTSLQGQDTRSADMVVYAKPRIFHIDFDHPDDPEETQIKCHVEGIFPEPQVLMYRVEQTHIAGNGYQNVDNMTQLNYSVQPAPAGPGQAQQRRVAKDGFTTIVTSSLSTRHFRRHASSRHLFFCVYTIPSTDIRQTRVLEYYPERYMSDSVAIKPAISISLLWAISKTLYYRG